MKIEKSCMCLMIYFYFFFTKFKKFIILHFFSQKGLIIIAYYVLNKVAFKELSYLFLKYSNWTIQQDSILRHFFWFDSSKIKDNNFQLSYLLEKSLSIVFFYLKLHLHRRTNIYKHTKLLFKENKQFTYTFLENILIFKVLNSFRAILVTFKAYQFILKLFQNILFISNKEKLNHIILFFFWFVPYVNSPTQQTNDWCVVFLNSMLIVKQHFI